MLIAFALIAGCPPKRISDRDLVLIDSSEAVELVAGRKKLLGLGKESAAVWVDPRSERVYQEGHIPGAVSLPYQNVTDEHSRLKGYDVIIVYGDDFGDTKAGAMSKRRMELGFGDVRTLRGGLRAWTAEGNELATGSDP
jgi:3-mercaptopyruvate sulfurtransferase SseA